MTEQEARAALRLTGIDVSTVWIWDDGSGRITVNYTGEVTFAQLTAVSEAFKTKRIDLGVDTGCASDPSVEPYLIIWTDPATSRADSAAAGSRSA